MQIQPASHELGLAGGKEGPCLREFDLTPNKHYCIMTFIPKDKLLSLLASDKPHNVSYVLTSWEGHTTSCQGTQLLRKVVPGEINLTLRWSVLSVTGFCAEAL